MPDPTSLPITADDIVDTVREPLLILDDDLRVRRGNRSFYQTFRVAPEDTEGRLVYELGNHQWAIPALRRLLEEVLPRNTVFNDFEVAHDFPAIGPKVMLLNARRWLQGATAVFALATPGDIVQLTGDVDRATGSRRRRTRRRRCSWRGPRDL